MVTNPSCHGFIKLVSPKQWKAIVETLEALCSDPWRGRVVLRKMLARRIAVLVVVGLLGCGPQPDWHTEHAKQWQRWNQIKHASMDAAALKPLECPGCPPRFGETKSVKSDRLSREAREYLRRIERNTRGLRKIQK